ncbi:uncharacterized protein LAJ45_02351 [Morchella importuna]|uniref:uncharacterized protein n=1 Tax=Morchella importuna TaxID=1174673 RepID=UPI001E8EA5C9|nr:uncharacterized protein LAJ45_02351 [Morchella importuna]KAH8153538.1 hypothetical protein LAJ45_02351 [Morchella importuna]
MVIYGMANSLICSLRRRSWRETSDNRELADTELMYVAAESETSVLSASRRKCRLLVANQRGALTPACM